MVATGCRIKPYLEIQKGFHHSDNFGIQLAPNIEKTNFQVGTAGNQAYRYALRTHPASMLHVMRAIQANVWNAATLPGWEKQLKKFMRSLAAHKDASFLALLEIVIMVMPGTLTRVIVPEAATMRASAVRKIHAKLEGQLDMPDGWMTTPHAKNGVHKGPQSHEFLGFYEDHNVVIKFIMGHFR